MIRRALLVIIAAVLGTALVAPAANAARTPSGVEYHIITFPVREHVTYYDDFGGVRHHPGNDLMGRKLDHELAAADGTVEWMRTDGGGHSGNMLSLRGTDGWHYWYIHVNNDTPGTDDGKNPAAWRFAPGITPGAKVKRGQFIAYMGDSGEAETTDPHLHFEIHHPDDSVIDPYTSLRLAQGAGANGLCSYPSNPTPHPNPAAGRGFWIVNGDGAVLAFGTVHTFGRPSVTTAMNPYVGIAPTKSGAGYWIVNAQGRVFPFGDAHNYGDASRLKLNSPMIGIAQTLTGHGYWLLARDGGIFTYGDAHFYGSTGSKHLNAPVIAMAATGGGHGYWLLASDGGIFTFGDAHFYGSTGSMRLNAPIVSMAATATGTGYWLIARDGGMFSFGDAPFYGSMPGYGWCAGPAAVAMARTTAGHGYWIMLADGRVLSFGDAEPWGQPASTRARAVAMAAAR